MKIRIGDKIISKDNKLIGFVRKKDDKYVWIKPLIDTFYYSTYLMTNKYIGLPYNQIKSINKKI